MGWGLFLITAEDVIAWLLLSKWRWRYIIDCSGNNTEIPQQTEWTLPKREAMRLHSNRTLLIQYLWCGVLWCTVLCSAVLCCAVVCCGVLWRAVACCGVQCCVLCAVVCCAVQCSALCCAVLWCGGCTMQCDDAYVYFMLIFQDACCNSI